MIVGCMSSPKVFVAAVLVVCAAACNSDSTSPSSNGSTLAPSVNTAVTQLTVVDVALGTGAVANSGNRITVGYTGYLYDASQPEQKGRPFDSNNAYTFTLGMGLVIKGWDQGIVGMRVGGSRRLIIPPSLAYGNQAVGTIPPNSTLVFDVRLISVG